MLKMMEPMADPMDRRLYSLSLSKSNNNEMDMCEPFIAQLNNKNVKEIINKRIDDKIELDKYCKKYLKELFLKFNTINKIKFELNLKRDAFLSIVSDLINFGIDNLFINYIHGVMFILFLHTLKLKKNELKSIKTDYKHEFIKADFSKYSVISFGNKIHKQTPFIKQVFNIELKNGLIIEFEPYTRNRFVLDDHDFNRNDDYSYLIHDKKVCVYDDTYEFNLSFYLSPYLHEMFKRYNVEKRELSCFYSSIFKTPPDDYYNTPQTDDSDTKLVDILAEYFINTSDNMTESLKLTMKYVKGACTYNQYNFKITLKDIVSYIDVMKSTDMFKDEHFNKSFYLDYIYDNAYLSTKYFLGINVLKKYNEVKMILDYFEGFVKLYNQISSSNNSMSNEEIRKKFKDYLIC